MQDDFAFCRFSRCSIMAVKAGEDKRTSRHIIFARLRNMSLDIVLNFNGECVWRFRVIVRTSRNFFRDYKNKNKNDLAMT